MAVVELSHKAFSVLHSDLHLSNCAICIELHLRLGLSECVLSI